VECGFLNSHQSTKSPDQIESDCILLIYKPLEQALECSERCGVST
jgi:hypothetical protein